MGGGKASSAGQQAAGAQEQIMQQIMQIWKAQSDKQRAAIGTSQPPPEYLAPGSNRAVFGGQSLTGGTPSLASLAPTSVTGAPASGGGMTASPGGGGAPMPIPAPGGPRLALPAPAPAGGVGGMLTPGGPSLAGRVGPR